MHKFRDGQGREWCVSLNIAQARKVKEQLDGLNLLDAEQLQRLAEDPYTAANVLYVLCERQCQAAGVTDEQFGEALAGDSFEEAVAALLQELVDFFPSRQRGPLKKVLACLEDIKGKAAALAEQKLDGPTVATAMQTILTQAEAQIDKQLAELTAGNGCGNAPELPA